VNLVESARSAVLALRANTLRSALTMLGVVIGVAEVIIMIALVAGANDRISEQIERLGSNMLVIRPGSSVVGGVSRGRGSSFTITEDDAAAVAREASAVYLAAPLIKGATQVVNGNLNWATSVQGITPEYFETRDWPVIAGRPFTAKDVEGSARVAVLGQTVAHQLFGDADPVDQDIRLRNVPFRVSGVLQVKGQTTWGEDLDDVVFVPISTAKSRLGVGIPQQPRAVHAILVKLKDGGTMYEAERQIIAVLRQRHRLQPDQDDDFWIQNLVELMHVLESTTSAATLLLAAVAAISLLVGGIGIMNIMLVSVTERTREIGVRMAVGARRRDILAQFLAEAVILALIGGALGIALGTGAASLVTAFAEWRTLIPLEAIAMAFAFSGAVGVFFGFYPARRASRLHPIEALRHE
jgi:putative ABC transport system permease protein